ncbi:GlcG/HbpS family heme-binding protein [Acidiphilium sp.]|uniref:GlcG/HbpS family heme-binding protein n=1 Tax=Acidiphilium sp. TaxID=527 RepID=UPI003D0007FB
MTTLTLTAADSIIRAARAHGRTLDLAPLTIVVLDAGGHMVALAREDRSGIARVEIATGKAWGGLAIGAGSRTLFDRWNAGGAGFLTGLAAATQGRMVPVPGGVLILDADQTILGAVGISGDVSDNDEACAIAGIAAAGFTPRPA